MNCREMNIENFIEELSSNAPTPGGGGASALCGAVGTALSSMVGALTTGKKRYAQFEGDLSRIITRARELNAELLALVDADRDAFLPLAKSYSMPQNTDEERAAKNAVLQNALIDATRVPLDIMRAACEGIELHSELVDKCSKIVISDVGVGIMLLRSALLGASLNVYINTKLIEDESLKSEFNAEADGMLEKYPKIADAVFEKVASSLR